MSKQFRPHLSDIAADGDAVVTHIGPCPVITAGEGSVVTGRFTTRAAANLLEVTLENGTKFTGTTVHPVWVTDVDDWVALSDLAEGDSVDTLDGELRVTSLQPLTHPTDVYNLEVQEHHVYRITDDGVLVHNSCADGAANGGKTLNGNKAVGQFGVYKITIDGVVHKFGKADLARITRSS